MFNKNAFAIITSTPGNYCEHYFTEAWFPFKWYTFELECVDTFKL